MRKAFLAIVAVLLLAQTASAHPGHDHSGTVAGVLHPLTGVDHLAAMIAVGLWGWQLGKKAIWLVPASFVLMMLAGAGLAFAGMPLPFAEQGIAASVLILGLLLVTGRKMPTAAGMALVALFALFHGWSHGHELSAGSSAVAYGVGFTLATIALHAAGIGLGFCFAAARKLPLVRLSGAVMALLGGLLLAGAV